jgi:2-polyprenyl-3-methyl-5-hydroxy-6-metoxy-1,4-benzoquinol methylase
VSACTHQKEIGVMFNPLTGGWMLAGDTDVNYMVTAKK